MIQSTFSARFLLISSLALAACACDDTARAVQDEGAESVENAKKRAEQAQKDLAEADRRAHEHAVEIERSANEAAANARREIDESAQDASRALRDAAAAAEQKADEIDKKVAGKIRGTDEKKPEAVERK